MQIQKNTLKFLKDLSENNNRDWFTTNKPRYLDAYQNMCSFADALILEMNKHDKLEDTTGKKSLFRIYNDVRFSKDKSPYNARFAFGLQRGTKLLRGGYYVNIKPGSCMAACGFFAPNADDLKRIRMDIDLNSDKWRKLLKSKNIKDNFGRMIGDAVATAPRGFAKDHEAIDLIRHKQFLFRHDFSDKEATSEHFVQDVNKVFKAIRPYFDYMSEVLTTDLNGVVIV